MLTPEERIELAYVKSRVRELEQKAEWSVLTPKALGNAATMSHDLPPRALHDSWYQILESAEGEWEIVEVTTIIEDGIVFLTEDAARTTLQAIQEMRAYAWRMIDA